MGYKQKPNKAVAKRFKVTATGKLKRHHALTSHLRSSRTAKKKRELRRPEITFEGLAKNMRRLMDVARGDWQLRNDVRCYRRMPADGRLFRSYRPCRWHDRHGSRRHKPHQADDRRRRSEGGGDRYPPTGWRP